ncbi:DUF5317 domain-containing protein [Parageobacillus thermoglucosidasius]|uniref:DUF5317 domain-containing protein n=2 Tax=Anoxybacillaceae TaxID=3120669 RepID=A0AAN0YQM3_PARTM|nr:DUF5317 domain-containing protein [Parageobacillus thermoglucosidasius]KYD17148.1 hypothetical protein B4168_1548 [Anoxybacillus flavithermus]REK59616.1 MAG: hypothetical protein C6P36_01865 [Geobacillus sp.]AEH48150.1 hypothetical protein Geoth_2216 [Parageobacillus thermoglucosidasius C56-YS93]ALF10622.1 hypothetical protein AOT13_11700 [Parageobacillus thermoglucosidasius]ANZ30700.1 hypothetical protein BCV53_11710 [Parageobacillus thermoglucosidasius]
MVYDGILLSLVIGFFRGGSLKGLAHMKLRGGWLFPLLLVVQFAIFALQDKVAIVAKLSNTLFLIVYAVGLLFLWINRKQPGFIVIFAGVLLNFIVMAVNGGRMPVSVEAAQVLGREYVDALQTGVYGKHQAITSETLLPFLGDIIPLSPPYPRQQVISIGDVIINVGAFFFIQHLMLNTASKERSTVPVSK